MEIRCKATKKLFPPSVDEEYGFMMVAYNAESWVDLPANSENTEFVAKGPLLPYSTYSEITLIGEWETTERGRVFKCDDYKEVIPHNPVAIVDYFCSLGAVNGDAARIYNQKGLEILDELPTHPEIISAAIANKEAAKRVTTAYLVHSVKKDIFLFLLKYLNSATTPLMAAQAAAKAQSLAFVKEDPFALSIDGLLPFAVTRKIAKACKISESTPHGIQAAMLDVLAQNEGSTSGRAFEGDAVGNTYLEESVLKQKTGDLVGIAMDSQSIADALNNLMSAGKCIEYDGKICLPDAFASERGIAEEISRLCSASIEKRNYQSDIFAIEDKKGMRLALEQCDAVNTALNNPVTILRGGPGTGKTSIEQYVIEIYRKYHKDPVMLIAPTGKAARRMSESTGEPACTVHRALGINPANDTLTTDVVLNAGLIICDEASMLDSRICYALFTAIKTGTQLVIVGDTNQLPSVGAGNVLHELIASNALPVASLDLVHRQAAGSTIAVNCARIKRGATTLDYSDTFIFEEVSTQEAAVEKILDIFEQEMASGLTLDDICILSPYRQNTATGVNNLNSKIQGMVTPTSNPSFSHGKKTFYLGDRVMLMTNERDYANGDVGYIVDVSEKGFKVDYGDGTPPRYYRNHDAKKFELAFGITIHKSQGSEYRCCIIVLMDDHKAMLKRNLLYTAVSRAKQKVYLVGTQTALTTAILTEDVTKRKSLLGQMVVDNINM